MTTKICETVGCLKEGLHKCPTCVKLKIEGSYFCSQGCFKTSWKEHKRIHVYEPWPGYEFSGKLRPYRPTPKRTVPESIAKPDYADDPDGYPHSEIAAKNSDIKVLDDEEIEQMKVVCKLAREVLDVAGNAIAVGVTTDEIDRLVHEASIERDCYPSPLNYYQFPKSCCTSVNEVICHGIPDTRPLQDGDLCNVDITVYHRGFHGDLNETFFVGNVSEENRRLVRVTYESIQEAINEVRPGKRYREIGDTISKYVQQHGPYSVVKSYCGHGIHRLFHTAPKVPHYAKNKTPGIMRAGHCFTIEPMISQGSWRDIRWPDDWTAVTEDGKMSAQFEQTLLVTDSGCEVLTRRREKNGQPHFMD